jgi:uncharacterized membrane protein YkoI
MPAKQKNKAKENMKTKHIILTVVALAIIAGFTAPAFASEDSQAKLEAKAKVSKADAQKTALAKVPNGTIKEGNLEMEKGKLIYSFDITTPDSKDITEVNVDAITGQIVAVEKETPQDQAKEAEKDKLKAQAKVSKADAEKIALAKVPSGTIKEGDLEMEKGKLIYSFDITTPGSKDITEVNVDAITGQVVAVEKETPEQQEKEEKGKKDKD